VKSLLKRHISFHSLNPELRERAIDVYIDRIDPSKTLLLSDEVKQLRRRLVGVFIGMQNGECDLLDNLHADLMKRYKKTEDEVRAFISDPNYKLDTDVVLILDAEKRGHPSTDEERKKLVERLLHFQMSNYLESDMELAEAKEKLIHRYELMTKRAGELEPREVYGNFLNAFAGALDPHSTYYPPEAVEDFEIQMSLSLDGIGVALSSRDGYSIVERIIPGGATDKSKALKEGDKIIAVAQEGEAPVDIVDMSLRDVVSQIRGKRGTTVHLTVLRKGETTERLQVAIKRDKVTIEDSAATLKFEEVEIGGQKKKLAILDLPTFYGDPDPAKRQSGRDVRELLRQVKAEKADGLLLDLSRNGGGKLESSVEIAGLFIREGGIVAVKDVFSQVQVLEDNDEDIIYDGPLVILTSRITASASEIVAGAMKDYERAVIVGDDHTFGKGTVQSFVHQPGRLGAIKVTTAMFFRPGGSSTQHEGVPADIVLPSLFATDDLGERYTEYSLGAQKIKPFLEPTFATSIPIQTQIGQMNVATRSWKPLTPILIEELSRRSAARVGLDKEFTEIKEKLAKQSEQDDVIHLADWIKEREDGESKDVDEAKEAAADARKTEDASPKTIYPDPESLDEGDESSDALAEKEPEPTPQQLEALRILADLVELQETDPSRWHAPQSALRSESPSSLP
jgi:carboxyl-terminal processing protease